MRYLSRCPCGWALLAWAALLLFAAPAALAQEGEAAAPLSAATCTAPPDVRPGAPMICRGRLSANGPDIEVRMDWRPSALGDQAEIHRLEIHRAGEDQPFQAIEGIDSIAFYEAEANGFELIDLNFDGWRDLRLIAFQPPGPNLPYLSWLWNPQTERFERAGMLDEIANARPDPQRRELVGFWRTAPDTYVTQAYRWQGEALEPVWRATERYALGAEDAVLCERRRERWQAGAWVDDGTESCP